MIKTDKQQGVLRGIQKGILLSFSTIILGFFVSKHYFNEVSSLTSRLKVAFTTLSFLVLILLFCIARIAKHRFFHEEDIDGGGLISSSKDVQIYQAILQNTVEQTLVAFIVYLSWSILMPAQFVQIIPMAGCVFFIGRILFINGYKNGAPARAMGFALTAYPTALMAMILILFVAST